MGISRKFKRRHKRSFTKQAGGGKTIPIGPELRDALERQRQKFIAKFGREPGKHDPIFFDPDASTPQPVPDASFRQAREVVFQKMNEMGYGANVHACRVTDRLLNDHNLQFLTDEEYQEAMEAMAEGKRVHADGGPCTCNVRGIQT